MCVTKNRRDETKRDLKEKLAIFSKCAVVRCTGFGKTFMLAELAPEYDSVLYLYPAEVVKETASSVITGVNKAKEEMPGEGTNSGNVLFMSYMKLIRLTDNEIAALGKKHDLIILDECHKCGAEETKKAVQKLMDAAEGHVIGATATPDRSDAVDIVREFFGGICTDEYSIHDAFRDGIIKRPVYTFMSYDVETDLKEEALTAGESFDDLRVTEVYKQTFFDMTSIFNVPSVIKNVTEKYVNEYSYMKYIAFFPDFEQLHKREKEVMGWFRKAFPGYKVNTLIITSETKEYRDNLEKLKDLRKKEKQIDLILVVDMLNLGYHVDDLTGIIMYRCTSSSIIYIQQLGRVLSTGSDRHCLVFDIVDNLHRKSVFTLAEKGKRRKKKDSAISIIKNTDIDALVEEEIVSLVEAVAASGSEHAKTAKKLIKKAKGEKNMAKKAEDYGLMAKFLKIIQDSGSEWWLKETGIHEKDIIPAEINGKSYEATYREMIAKTIALPAMMRARRAYEEHADRWAKINKSPYPSTREEMEQNINTVPPLEPYAKWQNVTVRMVLDTIFPEGTAV